MKAMLIAMGAAMVLAAPGLARAETACADLAKTPLAHAEVTSATAEKSGTVDLCKIAVTSRPTKDSDIRLEVWIPVGGAWNGKFVQLGNGGFAGTVPSGRLKAIAATGYATAGTDDGHQDPVGTSATWALGHPEKITDFGYRALKETTDIAKALIKAQKLGGPKTSYFYGCSDGGREALMEAQRYPNDFDGIVAGAPANYMSELFGVSAANQQALHQPGGYLDLPQLKLLQAAALADCGGATFVRDPAACRFDPGKLLCKAGQADGCLTAAQVHSARTIYAGRADPRTGKVAFPGFTAGAEAQGGSWQAWTTGSTPAANGNAAGYQFASNAFKYFAFQDPNYDLLTMDLGTGFDGAKAKMSSIIDSPDANLAAFKKRGGKLIQYHGWNDPAIPARSSIVYYEDVGRTMGDTSGFYRMYLIPGMLHCAGGPGPGTVDWLAVLDGWVAGGKAPAELTATMTAAGGDPKQLLCPYPGVAREDGKGGWACSVKKKG
ncbi:tannase/feruloyl esterase family alpha/beta hydrolase [Phenylobacterium sp.]|uniref:tannase/feruloyl esterase family alpha/beta hydrolase n=1 Tax=Phenylobacterium sp. TaxID=1871053 RepID=UPI0025CD97BD|nr:tannase/feruloyl esterase family alpha/beta hydrolase [Phenylobacterium sp.]